MNLEFINCVMFQDHLLTFVNETINNIVVFQRQELCISIFIILILNCLSHKILGVLKETQLAATSTNPDDSKRPGKLGETTSGDKESPQAEQNVASEPEMEENPQARDGVGLGSYDNDGYRTPEGQGNRVFLEGNMDLENDSPPSPPAISEEVPQELRDQFDNIFQGNRKI